MEKFKLGVRSPPQESTSQSVTTNDSLFPSDQTRIFIRANPGRMVSLSTCSKLCAFTFVVGVVVGFTLKRRVRRWASRLLKRIKDD